MEIQIKCIDETNIGSLNLTLTTKHKGISLCKDSLTNNYILSSDFGNQICIDITLTPIDITNIMSILSINTKDLELKFNTLNEKLIKQAKLITSLNEKTRNIKYKQDYNQCNDNELKSRLQPNNQFNDDELECNASEFDTY